MLGSQLWGAAESRASVSLPGWAFAPRTWDRLLGPVSGEMCQGNAVPSTSHQWATALPEHSMLHRQCLHAQPQWSATGSATLSVLQMWPATASVVAEPPELLGRNWRAGMGLKSLWDLVCPAKTSWLQTPPWVMPWLSNQAS